MDSTLIKETAKHLYDAEKNKQDIKKITAERLPNLTIEEAYGIQAELVNQKLADGHSIVGPKMGLTSEAKLKQMNVTDPIYGYVFDYMVVDEGDSISVKDYIHPKAEPEIGFVLKKDLTGPNVTREQVLEATDYVFPAIEIIDSRYENFNFTMPDVIADNTSARGAVFGTTLKKADTLELDVIGSTLSINGEIKSLGAGAAVLGHPANAIARLANMLAEKGETVKAGQPILTGAITAAVLLTPGDHVVAKFGGLGEVSFFVEE